jgi:hypothetical protein
MAKRENESPLADVECFDLAEELAYRMKLPPKKRAMFVHECMTRSGYEPVQTREAYARQVRDDEREEDKRGNQRRRRSNDDNDTF